MKTKYEQAEEYALSEGDNGSAEISFLAGWDAKAKQDEERIKELEGKLCAAVDALEGIAEDTGCEKHKTHDPCNSSIATKALTKIRGEEK